MLTALPRWDLPLDLISPFPFLFILAGMGMLLTVLYLQVRRLGSLSRRQHELLQQREAELRQTESSLQRETAQRKEAEKRLHHISYHDSLTGFPNHELFSEYHQHAFAKFSRREAPPYAVLFLDLDDFKYINDTYGHCAGDTLLQETAARLQHCVREVDTIGRLGGDEFIVLIEDFSDPSHTIKVAERILSSISAPYHWNGRDIKLGISIGIAFSERRHTEPKEIIRDADAALYHAKASGKRRYSIFEGKLQHQAIKRMQIEQALRETSDGGGFTLKYQPIIDLERGKLKGFEALLRWEHPQIGSVSPSIFIPIAEQNGQIFSLGRWALTRACCDMARWLEDLLPEKVYTISVNISPKQLQSQQLLEEVQEALNLSGLEARHLVLEVTESALIPDPESTLSILDRLKEMGVQLHLDDFGEGFSSVGLLYRFPFDTMKIDRSYVTGVMQGTCDCELVRNIIDLGHSLNKAVIAEGIEQAGEAEVLKSFHCELGQGYYFSHPLSPEEARIFIGADELPNSMLN